MFPLPHHCLDLFRRPARLPLLKPTACEVMVCLAHYRIARSRSSTQVSLARFAPKSHLSLLMQTLRPYCSLVFHHSRSGTAIHATSTLTGVPRTLTNVV